MGSVAKIDATDDIVEGLEAGAADYITKPLEESELRARMNVGIRTIELQNKLVDFDMLFIKIQDIEGLQKYVDSI